jgi:two-component system response regulator PilR (NtrC family)
MAPVLVHGESGTGKELVARAIHDVSARAGQPFVAVNCGAIPETLLEAEFFGVRKGAFTGANADRDGFFQTANGGTLFLDEIGDLPFAMQSKLLRAIQERAVRPVGAPTELTVNVRIVSATHKDLAAEVQAGRFRQDLFYRLNVIGIKVPPLRERLADLSAIADALLARLSREAGVSPPPRLHSEARRLLARYAFPGNVRELENLLHRAVALADGEELQVDFQSAQAPVPDTTPPDAAKPKAAPVVPQDLQAYLDQQEREILVKALHETGFNRTAAAQRLGLSLRQIRYRIARLAIAMPGGSNDDPHEDS